jgi:hypothetical protein
MENKSEAFVLFNSYWWLILVLFWMGFAIAKHWLAHRRANHGLEILKSYVDQGKEPPPELLQYLRAPPRRDRSPANGYFLAILFAGLASAFAFIAQVEQEPHIYFVVIIMGALSIGSLVQGLMQRQNPRDPQ